MSFTLMISVGRYGGFHNQLKGYHGKCGDERRIVLGWVAIGILTPEFDVYLDNIGREIYGLNWTEFAAKTR